MCHEQDVADRCFTLRLPNGFIVEAHPYIFNQSIQSFRHLRRRFPTWTSIPPDIPPLLLSRLLPLCFYLRARQAFVVAIVPFPDVGCDLHFCFRTYVAWSVMNVFLPGQFVPAANVEEFEGAAGAGAGGYVAVGTTSCLVLDGCTAGAQELIS